MTDNRLERDLGDRMKSFERAETAHLLRLDQPIYVRLDGRAFSNFTKGLARPFDERLSLAMIALTRILLEELDADIGYTQSDEVSIAWLPPEAGAGTRVPFNGKAHKLTSVLAGMASSTLMLELLSFRDPSLEPYVAKRPHFDARVINIPTLIDLCDMFLWRSLDASKNAISMVAMKHFSHKELKFKSVPERLSILAEKGIMMSDYPGYFRFGTFFRRRKKLRPLAPEEIQSIPERHRPAPNFKVERSVIEKEEALHIRPFRDQVNRLGFIQSGEDPVFGEMKL